MIVFVRALGWDELTAVKNEDGGSSSSLGPPDAGVGHAAGEEQEHMDGGSILLDTVVADI